MSNSIPSMPAAQHKQPPQDTARPAALGTSPLDHFVNPIAVAPARPVARGWLQALLPGFGSSRGRIADIQKSMLDELSQVASVPLHEEALARLIVQAADAETLWQLRPALQEAIETARGELIARQKITEISFMFAGLLHRRSGSLVHRASVRGQQPDLRS